MNENAIRPPGTPFHKAHIAAAVVTAIVGLAALGVTAIAAATLAGSTLLRDAAQAGRSLTWFELLAGAGVAALSVIAVLRLIQGSVTGVRWMVAVCLACLYALIVHGFWTTSTWGGLSHFGPILMGAGIFAACILALLAAPPVRSAFGDTAVQRARVFMQKAALHTALLLASVIMLTPLVWLVAAAFKPTEIFFTYVFFPPPDVVAELVHEGRLFDNFRNLFVQMPFHRLMLNSFFITGTTVMVQLFFASLGGFALAKYNFRFKKPIMILMLGTMMIPAQVMLAPLYELIAKVNLLDSHFGLIVPGMVSVFGMFLFRQSMLQIPDELLEAGRVDGCSEFGLYWTVAVPISRPMIGAFCLIAFMGTWNSFLWPQIILQSESRFTLPIGLNQLVGLQQQDYGTLMAGTLLSILPVVILFFILQREFVSGLTAGAVKG